MHGCLGPAGDFLARDPPPGITASKPISHKPGVYQSWQSSFRGRCRQLPTPSTYKPSMFHSEALGVLEGRGEGSLRIGSACLHLSREAWHAALYGVKKSWT